jgi:hypothetical protein
MKLPLRTEPTPEPAKPLGSGTARLDVPDESASCAAALPEAGTGVVTFPPGAARHVSNFIPLTPLDLAQQKRRASAAERAKAEASAKKAN